MVVFNQLFLCPALGDCSSDSSFPIRNVRPLVSRGSPKPTETCINHRSPPESS